MKTDLLFGDDTSELVFTKPGWLAQTPKEETVERDSQEEVIEINISSDSLNRD
jgi:hypothetical protein